MLEYHRSALRGTPSDKVGQRLYNGTESVDALSEIQLNSSVYAMLDCLVQKYWKGYNVLMGFAMDHGCHDTDSGAGTHGIDDPSDRNVTHFYKAYKKEI